jgi:hypothetical protein
VVSARWCAAPASDDDAAFVEPQPLGFGCPETPADPAKHAAIDGTGWVAESPDDRPLTAVGQTFRMTMHHANHPDGNYEMANRIQVFEPPNAISWEPGYDAGDGSLRFGGWTWRYDLTPAGPSETKVTPTYDWSAVPGSRREHIGIPPFPPDHSGNSPAHLADLATSRQARRPANRTACS